MHRVCFTLTFERTEPVALTGRRLIFFVGRLWDYAPGDVPGGLRMAIGRARRRRLGRVMRGGTGGSWNAGLGEAGGLSHYPLSI